MPAIIFYKQNNPEYVAIIAEADHTPELVTWAKGVADTHGYDSYFSVLPAWDCVDTTQDLDERLAADHPEPAPPLAQREGTKNSGRLGLTFASPESTQFQTGYIYKTIQEAREAAQKGLAVCWQLKGKVGPDLVAKALDTQVDSMTNPENHHDVFYAQIQDTETTLEEWGIDTDTGLPVCTDHGIDPETPLQGIREIARRNSWSKDALLQHIFNFLEEDKDAAERLLTYVVTKGL